VSRENVLRHMIRLLCWIHQHVDSSVLEQLVKSVQPTRQVQWWLDLLFCAACSVCRFTMAGVFFAVILHLFW